MIRKLLNKYGIKSEKLKEYHETKEDNLDYLINKIGEKGVVDLIYEYTGQQSFSPPCYDSRSYLMMKRFYNEGSNFSVIDWWINGSPNLNHKFYDNYSPKIRYNITHSRKNYISKDVYINDLMHFFKHGVCINNVHDIQDINCTQLFELSQREIHELIEINEKGETKFSMYFEMENNVFYVDF